MIGEVGGSIDLSGAAGSTSSARPINPEPLSSGKARQLNRDISSAAGTFPVASLYSRTSFPCSLSI